MVVYHERGRSGFANDGGSGPKGTITATATRNSDHGRESNDLQVLLLELHLTIFTLQEEIRARVQALQHLSRPSQSQLTMERSRLESEKSLASRRGDLEVVAELEEKLRELTHSLSAVRRKSQDDKGEDELARKLAIVNEKNRKAALANSRRAHQAELEKRKQIEEGAIYDPSARVKMRLKQHDAA